MSDEISPEALQFLVYSTEEGGYDYHPLNDRELVKSLLGMDLITTETKAETLDVPFSAGISPFMLYLFSLASLADPFPVDYARITPAGREYLAQHTGELEARVE